MELGEILDEMRTEGIDFTLMTWFSGDFGLHDPYEVILTHREHGLLAVMTGTDLMGTIADAITMSLSTLTASA